MMFFEWVMHNGTAEIQNSIITMVTIFLKYIITSEIK